MKFQARKFNLINGRTGLSAYNEVLLHRHIIKPARLGDASKRRDSRRSEDSGMRWTMFLHWVLSPPADKKNFKIRRQWG